MKMEPFSSRYMDQNSAQRWSSSTVPAVNRSSRRTPEKEIERRGHCGHHCHALCNTDERPGPGFGLRRRVSQKSALSASVGTQVWNPIVLLNRQAPQHMPEVLMLRGRKRKIPGQLLQPEVLRGPPSARHPACNLWPLNAL